MRKLVTASLLVVLGCMILGGSSLRPRALKPHGHGPLFPAMFGIRPTEDLVNIRATLESNGDKAFVMVGCGYEDQTFTVSVWASLAAGPDGSDQGWEVIFQDTTGAAGGPRSVADSTSFACYALDSLDVVVYAHAAGGSIFDTTTKRILLFEQNDTQAPEFISDVLAWDYNGNGEHVTLTLTAETDEPCKLILGYEYVTTYDDLISPQTQTYAYKTAAVDTDSVSTHQYLTADDVAITMGPQCYNGDLVVVTAQAEDLNGHRSPIDTLFNGPLQMPIGDIPTVDADGSYKIASTHNGGWCPTSGTPAQIAESDIFVCQDRHIFETYGYDANGYRHWVDQVRDAAGSNNEMVLGFTDLTIWQPYGAGYTDRAYARFMGIYNDAVNDGALGLAENGYADTLVLVHDIAGAVIDSVRGSSYPQSYCINIAYAPARAYLKDFIVSEFNHAENRRANVGLLFDVWEYPTHYCPSDEVDFDQDGTALIEDEDDQIAVMAARRAFPGELRAAIYASATDTLVGRHFLIGANSVGGKSDPEMISQLDFVMAEDMQCDPSCGGVWGDDPWWNSMWSGYLRTGLPAYYLIADSLTAPVDLASMVAAMRDTVGAVVLLEANNSCGDATVEMDPEYLEVLSLFRDGVAAIYLDYDGGSTTRSWNDPTERGYSDLHGLGASVGSSQTSFLADSTRYMVRDFANGTAEMKIMNPDTAAAAGESCANGDLFDYCVVMNGDTVRVSADWSSVGGDIIAPTITFNSLLADSSGDGGAVRLLANLSFDEAAWDTVSWKQGIAGAWNDTTGSDSLSVGGSRIFDTGVSTADAGGDTFWVNVMAKDAASPANVGGPTSSSVVFTRAVPPEPEGDPKLYIIRHTTASEYSVDYTIADGGVDPDTLTYRNGNATWIGEIQVVESAAVASSIISPGDSLTYKTTYAIDGSDGLPLETNVDHENLFLYFPLDSLAAAVAVDSALVGSYLSNGTDAGNTWKYYACEDANLNSWTGESDASYGYYDVSGTLTWATHLSTYTPASFAAVDTTLLADAIANGDWLYADATNCIKRHFSQEDAGATLWGDYEETADDDYCVTAPADNVRSQNLMIWVRE